MSFDFTYGNSTINSSGGFIPTKKNAPTNPREVVDTYGDIANIPNPYVGLTVTVKVDETNNNKMTDYKVISLKSNNLGIADMLIDQVQRIDEYLGVLKEVPAEYVTETEMNEAIANISSGGSVSQEDISTAVNNYLTEHPVTGGATPEQANQISTNKTDIATLKELVGDSSSGLVKAVTDNASQLDKKASEIDLEIERNRINNIVAVKDSVDNLETADIRVGADGKVYGSAGEAVREIAKGKAIDNSFGDGLVGTYNLVNLKKCSNNSNLNFTTGELISGNYLVSDYIEVIKDYIYSLYGCFNNNNNHAVLYDENKNFIKAMYIGRLKGEYGNLQYKCGWTYNPTSSWLNDESQKNVKYIRIVMDSEPLKQMLVVGETYPSQYYEYNLNLKSELLSTVIDDKINEVVSNNNNNNNNNNNIVCWGDSKTEGNQDSTGVSYPSHLQTLLARDGHLNVVKNNGVGGEYSVEIMQRQGSYPLIVQPFTIPNDTSEVRISINSRLKISSKHSFNPVFINGVKGTIRKDWADNTHKTFYFKREVSGDSITVNRPTQIVSSNMINDRNDILIIDIGCNGGYSSIDEWIQQIRNMVDYSRCKEYIVIGLAINKQYSLGTTGENYTTLEDKFIKAFGNRYINLRKYYVEYGLQDAGLVATDGDNEDIANNIPPRSLFVSGDVNHENQHGYKIKAELVFKKLKELLII